MPRIHTIEVERLTPLGRLIFEYMRRRWLPTKSAFAQAVGIRPNTVDSLLYSDHEPSTRTLRKIVEKTDIPATTIYAAVTPPPAALPMPAPRRVEQDPAPRLVDQQSAYAARDTYLRRIEGLHLDPATKQELIEMFLAALPAAPPIVAPRSALRDRLNNEEHNHDFIETLEHPTAPPASTAAPTETQAESQSASTYSSIRR